jgi:HK97 family phage major capsid protein
LQPSARHSVADWKRALTVIHRPGLKFLRDPFSAKPYVLLYATRRVGGQSSGDLDALKLCKVATS